MTTPHISAKVGDFAPSCLLPGDPLRAKFIAENFLSNVKQVTEVRGMLGFTGEYKGKPVSVMGSGMGIPSCSIYVNELFNHYGVENIIRVGTCGGTLEDIKVGDVILAIGACTDSGVNRERLLGHDFAATPNFDLLVKAHQKATEMGIKVNVGNVFSADVFYRPNGDELLKKMQEMNILGIEMELAGLYGLAASYKKRGLGILTVSDHLVSGESMSSLQRQTTLTNMIEIALETCI